MSSLRAAIWTAFRSYLSKSNYPNADYPNIRLSEIFLGGWSKSIVFLL
ncbi:hypothetical protein T4E_8250 [Trichinella pseudospiralis]|uniref:Uncharacterized protein n=1 Tax=Trichinella pseudospiralis TaxID=6337 RepID=A0A0V0Y836_TRIPS|nr:hypothetical protein T4E_8250 [Trichinella pseudospiralis]